MLSRKLAKYFAVDKELIIVFLLVAVTGIIYFFVSNQWAFLNFFYLPVLVGAYFFGKRYATHSALLSIILVSLIAYYYPSTFTLAANDELYRWLDIATWGSFLVITGYLMGHLYEKKERANKEIKKTYQGIIEMMSLIIDSTDKATQSHSYRVSVISGMIAREMGLSEVWVENIRIGALLHDLGKLGVSSEVLKKIDKMTTEEYGRMEIRTTRGTDALEPVCGKILDILPSILYNREKFDGSGEFHMAGDEIPLGARIIAVADSYDMLNSDRFSGKDVSPVDSKKQMMERAQTDFDQGVLKAFISILPRLDVEIPRTLTKEIKQH
ncbi:MAG: HD domain-containing phosphohydrolase [Thermodesulfovibrionales bacterium]